MTAPDPKNQPISKTTPKRLGKGKSTDRGFASLSDLFSNYQFNDGGGHISKEFQDYGYRLAVELDDLDHKSLYIKMAKDVDRGILESARTFILDANARNRARLFMWKVKQLRIEQKAKRLAK